MPFKNLNSSLSVDRTSVVFSALPLGRSSAECSFVPRGITIGGGLTAKTSTGRAESFADASTLILLRFFRSLFLLRRHDRDFLCFFVALLFLTHYVSPSVDVSRPDLAITLDCLTVVRRILVTQSAFAETPFV